MKDIQIYQTFDLEKTLPSLRSELEEAPIDLSSDYWTPEDIGETKYVFFNGVQNSIVETEDGNRNLETAFFIEETESGDYIQISNSSKRLVGIFKDRNIERGAAFKITYKGKVKNITNQYHSDSWEVKPLVLKKKNEQLIDDGIEKSLKLSIIEEKLKAANLSNKQKMQIKEEYKNYDNDQIEKCISFLDKNQFDDDDLPF